MTSSTSTGNALTNWTREGKLSNKNEGSCLLSINYLVFSWKSFWGTITWDSLFKEVVFCLILWITNFEISRLFEIGYLTLKWPDSFAANICLSTDEWDNSSTIKSKQACIDGIPKTVTGNKL